MNMCSDDHDEIVYEGRDCPLCNVVRNYEQEIVDLEAEVESLQTQIDGKDKEIDQLLSRLEYG